MLSINRLVSGSIKKIPFTHKLVELAKKVSHSPSACLRCVQELEKSGAIIMYRAVLSPEKPGRSFIAYVTVGLSDHTMNAQKAFEISMSDSPQVRECHYITGSFEYLLRVEVSDMAHYKQFHAETLGALPQVCSLTTYVVIESLRMKEHISFVSGTLET